MGELRTSIVLEDKVSNKLKAINYQINKTIKTMSLLNKVGDSFNGGSMSKAIQSWSNTAKNAINGVAQAQKTAGKMAHDHQKSLDKRLELQTKARVDAEKAAELSKINTVTAKKIAGARAAAQIAIENKKHENRLTLEKQKQLNWQERFNASLQRQQAQYQGIFGQLRLWGSRIRNILTMYYAIQGVVRGVGKAVQLSDKMTMADARLNLVAKGDKKAKDALEASTFYAAQRSTSDYLTFTKSVGKLGVLAGDKFKNNESIVRFVELMNKSFLVSGAETSERNAAMLQITQAIASNRLQGDEFRSILENAPMVMEALAKSLGVGHNKLKEMAKEGKITADVLIKSMFDASSKIEEMYKQIPMTWERHWAKMKNVGVLAFKPIQEQFKRLFNSEKFKAFIDGICTAMIVMGNITGKIFKFLLDGFGKFIDVVKKASDVFRILRDVIVAVTYATAIYGVVWAIVNWRTTLAVLGTLLIIKALVWLGKVAIIVAAIVGGIGLAFEIVAKAEQLASIWSAIWQVITGNAVFIIIAILALLIYWLYTVSDSWADVTGKIVGAVMWLAALLSNIFWGLVATIAYVLGEIVNKVIAMAEHVYNSFTGGFTSWIDGAANAIGHFIAWALEKIRPLVEVWDKIKGTNLSASLTSTQNKLKNYAKTSSYKKFDRVSWGDDIVQSKIVGLSDAYNFGYGKGSGWINKLSDKWSKMTKGMTDIEKQINDLKKAELGGQKVAADALNGVNDKLGEGNDLGANTAKNTGDTAKNTAKTTDYSYLRDWYYQRGLGNSIGYTIKIEQNNRNNIASGVDVNKFMNMVRDEIVNALVSGKERVGEV